MYKALDIAKYIINKCLELNISINNLQLQKMLYYVQGEYMRENDGKALFYDDIEAWEYGVSIPSVYYKYFTNSSTDIMAQEEEVQLNEEIKNIIDMVIKEKGKFSPWELSMLSRLEEPWKITYEKGLNKIIPKNVIYNYFKKY